MFHKRTNLRRKRFLAIKSDANMWDGYHITMRNKVGKSEFSTGSIKLEKAKFYTQAFVFLYLFVYTSAEAQLGCSVTRARFGDRFVFFNYSGTCNKGINPCKQIKGVWRNSARNCLCQCARSNSTYREDLGSCVENAASREGRYPYAHMYKTEMVIMVKSIFLHGCIKHH